MFHLNDEFAATKVRSCFFARPFQFRCPWCDELSFDHQPTLPSVIDARDFQHCLFPLANKARQEPNSINGKSLNFQETDARTRMIGVEEVKTVKTVEATSDG
jgi:hypothetical protein